MSSKRKAQILKNTPTAKTPSRRISQFEQMDLATRAPVKAKKAPTAPGPEFNTDESSPPPSSPSPTGIPVAQDSGRITRSSASRKSESSSSTSSSTKSPAARNQDNVISSVTNDDTSMHTDTSSTPTPTKKSYALSNSAVNRPSARDLAIAKVRKMLAPLKKGPTVFEGATPGDDDADDPASDEASEILKDLLGAVGVDLANLVAPAGNAGATVAGAGGLSDDDSDAEPAVTYHYFGLAQTDSEPEESDDEPVVKMTRKEKTLKFREKLQAGASGDTTIERKRKGSFEPPTVDKRLKVNKIHENAVEKQGGLPSNWRNKANNKKSTHPQSSGDQTAKPAAIMSVAGGLIDDLDDEASVGVEGASKAKPTLVKLEMDKPAKTVDGPNKTKAKSASRKPTNEDLRLTSAQLQVWRSTLCPTWYTYLASLDTIWGIGTDEDTLANIEYLYNKVIAPLTGKQIDNLTTSSVVYRLLAQRGYEHRGAVADWAVANAIDYFFETGEVDNPAKYSNVEDRILYIQEAINGATFSFIYEKPETKSKIFRTPHVLATFGFVHRALELWGDNNGVKPAVRGHAKFSHAAHGKRAAQYLTLIAKLNDRQWRDIIKRARETYALATKQPVPANLKATNEDEKPSKEDEKFMALEVRESSDIEEDDG
ncbi:hypothetical protein CC1G_04065 [Coprinopsis cinerea okayama7|uniref:Uncharacterized protein n=1 Tax=Coprinopsis cinerea (strain Okayama-7 / 130 / ATCC MYA-4618 / FGSC 9003) TaxID=240176 RepID=A8NVT6_COPC7|nr:hypothetical protein CC1G_04065 [Coprinopsis cinerea okayama7\|eukprot:XP_001836752.2 hypothetical protein CC1G_04065 [Coprinopsis cinerea okayama7\